MSDTEQRLRDHLSRKAKKRKASEAQSKIWSLGKGKRSVRDNPEFVEKLLRYREVESMIGFRRSTIYFWMSEGRFPAPVKIGRAVAWKKSDVLDWIDSAEVATSADMAGDAGEVEKWESEK